jgi:hypothetical protein
MADTKQRGAGQKRKKDEIKALLLRARAVEKRR